MNSGRVTAYRDQISIPCGMPGEIKENSQAKFTDITPRKERKAISFPVRRLPVEEENRAQRKCDGNLLNIVLRA